MAIKVSNQITFTEQKKIVEIQEWYLATSVNTGITTTSAGWTQTVQTMDDEKKYLWNYEKVIYSIGDPEISEPVIIGFYGQGAAGKGISNIENYYQTTQNLVAPSLPTGNETSSWTSVDEAVANLSPTNKYLWNYEAIVYTDGTLTLTDPAVIGIYGDSGKDAVVFEIYSNNGFIFTEKTKSITLKVAAFEGEKKITGAKYTWSYEIQEGNEDSGDVTTEIIKDNTSETTFTVDETMVYAFENLKCTMTYKGSAYEKYVKLSNETVNYTTTAKFLGGSNIFTAVDKYLVVGLDLYQNGQKIEGLNAEEYCTGIVTITNGVITPTGLGNDFNNGDVMYFVSEAIISDEQRDNPYQVVLGEYNSTDKKWYVVTELFDYTYENTLYPSITSPIMAIPKEKINKSGNISFNVRRRSNNKIISSTHVSVIDSNDPIVSESEPDDPVLGQLWLHLSSGMLKVCVKEKTETDPAEWHDTFETKGKTVFTSKPNSYSEGDLWILGANESVEYTVEEEHNNEEVNVERTFGPGSMLKATSSSDSYNATHWIDADEATTSLKNSIGQHFEFNSAEGVVIKQTDDKFFVQISATEMGFYDNTSSKKKKVVSIGNESALIQNLNVEEKATFNCPSTFKDSTTFQDEVVMGKFKWITETDGSFSLVLDS